MASNQIDFVIDYIKVKVCSNKIIVGSFRPGSVAKIAVIYRFIHNYSNVKVDYSELYSQLFVHSQLNFYCSYISSQRKYETFCFICMIYVRLEDAIIVPRSERSQYHIRGR